jgi:aspartate/methionine/tyrosine aminotransferase
MRLKAQSLLQGVSPPPIEEALSWAEGREFPADRPLIDLCQAVPGYPPPEALTEVMADALRRPATHRYTDVRGLPGLREALARDIGRAYGAGEAVGAENVLITAGCNQAFCLAMLALTRPGDEVILPLPCYFNYLQWLEMNGVAAHHVGFSPQTRGLPDLAEIEAAIGERTRALVLISPNNPTGAVYPADYLEAAFDLCRQAGIALVLDETYRDFLPTDQPAHALFGRDGWASTLVHLYSFSKVFCLTGHRVGAIVGEPAFLREVGKAMDCVAICAPHLGQIAAEWGLAHLESWRRANTELMRTRLEALKAAFAGGEAGYELITAGGFFAYVRHPHLGRSSEAVAKRLVERRSLLTLPGSIFGPDQDRYLRLAFANVEASAMPEIAARLAADAADPF